MRWELGNEWMAFARSFGEGAVLSLLFDLFRMARVHFRWKDHEVALMDLFYWLLAAPIAFLFLLRSSDGVIRWYLLTGWGVGWFLWHITFGRLLLFAWQWLTGILILFLQKAAAVIRKKAEKFQQKRQRKRQRKEEQKKRLQDKRSQERKKVEKRLWKAKKRSKKGLKNRG